jgi:putative FmdB family regulatory protein
MPIYEYYCPRHGRYDHYKSVKQFSKTDHCPECGKLSQLVFSKPGKHIVDFTAGWNGGAGKTFESKTDRETWMREHNAVRA